MGYFEDNLSLGAVQKSVTAKLAADRFSSDRSTNPVVAEAPLPIANNSASEVGDALVKEPQAEAKDPGEAKTPAKADDFKTVTSNWNSLDEASKKKFLESAKRQNLNVEQHDALVQLMQTAPKEESAEMAAILGDASKQDADFIGPTLQGSVALNAEKKAQEIAANPDTGSSETTTRLYKKMATDTRYSEAAKELLASKGIEKVSKEEQLAAHRTVLEANSKSSKIRDAVAKGVAKLHKDNVVKGAKQFLDDKNVDEHNRDTLAKQLPNVVEEQQVDVLKTYINHENVSENNRTTVAKVLPEFKAGKQQEAVSTYLDCTKVNKDNKIALAGVLSNFDKGTQVAVLDTFMKTLQDNNPDNTAIRNTIAESLPNFAQDNQKSAVETYIAYAKGSDDNLRTLYNLRDNFSESASNTIYSSVNSHFANYDETPAYFQSEYSPNTPSYASFSVSDSPAEPSIASQIAPNSNVDASTIIALAKNSPSEIAQLQSAGYEDTLLGRASSLSLLALEKFTGLLSAAKLNELFARTFIGGSIREKALAKIVDDDPSAVNIDFINGLDNRVMLEKIANGSRFTQFQKDAALGRLGNSAC